MSGEKGKIELRTQHLRLLGVNIKYGKKKRRKHGSYPLVLLGVQTKQRNRDKSHLAPRVVGVSIMHSKEIPNKNFIVHEQVVYNSEL